MPPILYLLHRNRSATLPPLRIAWIMPAVFTSFCHSVQLLSASVVAENLRHISLSPSLTISMLEKSFMAFFFDKAFISATVGTREKAVRFLGSMHCGQCCQLSSFTAKFLIFMRETNSKTTVSEKSSFFSVTYVLFS